MCLKCSRKRDSATRQNISNDFKYQEKYTNAHRVSIFLPVFTTLLVTPARCIHICVCYIIWWRHGHRNLSFLIFESRRYVSKELLFHFIRIAFCISNCTDHNKISFISTWLFDGYIDSNNTNWASNIKTRWPKDWKRN